MKLTGREIRHKKLRKKITGSKVKPRLCVFRSLKHTYAQLVDDIEGKTLCSLSTNNSDIRKNIKQGGNAKAAVFLG